MTTAAVPISHPDRPQLVALVPLDAIRPSPGNPRRFRPDDPGLQELAASIQQHGVVQPIVIRPIEPGLGAAIFELVAGERRWRAARIAGLEAIPAIARQLTAEEALEITVTENLQREDLSPLEEALGVQALIDRAGWTAAAVADKLGRPLSWVVRRARLSTLSPAWCAASEDDREISQWTAAHLELVARLQEDQQDQLLEGLKSAWRHPDHGIMSVDGLRAHVANFTGELRHFPWPLDDAGLVPAAGACTDCPKRSSCHPGLFDEEEVIGHNRVAKGDRCLDRACADRKHQAYVEARKMHLRAQHGGALVLVRGPEYDGDQKPPKGETWVQHHQAPREKKGGKIPCLIVTGKRAGQLYWGAKAVSAAAGRRRGGEAATAKAPASLAERKKKLEARRKAHAIQALQAALKDEKKLRQPADHLVLALVATFGTSHRFEGRHGYGNYSEMLRNHAPALHVRLDRLGGDREASLAQLWLSVRPVLVANLQTWNLDQVDDAWQYARRFAAALAINLVELLEAAEKAIPTPKSWATEGASSKRKASGKRGGGRRVGTKAAEAAGS